MTSAELLPALQFTPPVISLNFDELEDKIKAITETYTGLVVQEKDVPAIKNEMAGLNKVAAQLADARKEAVSKVSGPIKEFEDRVKGLESSVKDTRTFLDEQVKAHIQRERDQRRARVQFMVDAQKDEHGCRPLDIPLQENWLNKTITDKQITSEIQGIILRHKKDEAEREALAQARKDRVLALENHIKAMEQSRNYTFSFSAFTHLQSLDVPLAEALAQIEKIYAAEDQRILEISQSKPYVAPHFTDPPPEPEVEVKKAIQKAMTITATYDSENGPKIQALYQQIKSLCLTCTAQIKEI